MVLGIQNWVRGGGGGGGGGQKIPPLPSLHFFYDRTATCDCILAAQAADDDECINQPLGWHVDMYICG